MAKRSRSVKGTCIFCGRYGPLTKEDALPTWLMQMIPTQFFSWGKTPTEWQANKTQAAAGYRLKIQALCSTCNNSWLGPIEKRAKPKLSVWMTGLYSPMTYQDQRLLSFWAVKTAMTVQVAHPRAKRVIPMDQYHQLHVARIHPPTGFYVWVGILQKRLPGIGFSNRWVVEEPPMGPAYEVRIVIRHLSLWIVGCHGVDQDETAKSISEVEGFASTMHQIWPAVSRHLVTPQLA